MTDTQRPNDEEKIMRDKIQKRFKSMFSGKGEPLSNLSIHEVEAMKSRIAHLEAELAEQPPYLKSSNVLTPTDRSVSPRSTEPSQKRQRARVSVALKSVLIIGLIFILAAVFQYQFNFNIARQEIEKSARQHSEANYESYISRILVERNTAEALAASIAQRTDVQDLYRAGDKQALYELLLPMFNELKQNNRIVHLYLEDAEGTVFLRVHDPEHFGDDVTYRGTTADALNERRITSGIEIGANRIGVRGVAPMYVGNSLIGLVEVGLDFDEQFVNDLKDLHGADYSMWLTYEAAGPAGMKPKETSFRSPLETMFYYTGTISSPWNIAPEVYQRVLATGEPAFEVITQNTDSPSIVYIVPLRGYKNKIIGILEIADSYRNTLSALKNTQIYILELVSGFALLSLALIAFFYQRLILRPLSALADFAQYQLSGDTSRRVFISSNDEFGQLATSFNSLADSVNERHRTLEQRILERTHDLELASEVGRTVAEKVTDLSEMLTEAVESIHTRFHLYYTQIYLVDPSGQTLSLRAGTGQVGQELLQRGHSLPINDSSLNGRAVMEKQAQLVADTKENPSFMPNPLLPDTQSEMCVPLIVSGRVVGVLDMQSEKPGALSQNNLPAFQALAGQLAIAIQNAALFAEVQEARAEVESQVRRLTEQGWSDFLNAIDRGEKIGFAFEQSEIVRLQAGSFAKDDRGFSIPLNITGTKVGEIHLPAQPAQSYTNNELELIQATGAQLAQHIENLRLLAQAEQYRAEAEQALQRLTHEGWNAFLQTHNKLGPGYVFDLIEVRPLSANSNGHSEQAIKHWMAVGNQAIGELTVNVSEQSEEAAEVIAAVANQLSSHIENLRLSELNEQHAQRERTLRQITSALRSSNNPESIMRTAVRELGSILGRRTVVQLAKPPTDQSKSGPGNGNESDAPAYPS